MSRQRRLRIWQRFRSGRLGMWALAWLAFIAIVAIFAPWLAPKDPLEQNLTNLLQGPSWGAPFGTDHLGRDTLSRLMWAARVDVKTAVLATSMAAVIGIPIGLALGYMGKSVDWVAMRTFDAIQALPAIIVLTSVIAVVGTGTGGVILALGVLMAAAFARQVRAETLSARQEVYVSSAVVMGVSSPKILRKHILPNLLPSLAVFAALMFGSVLLALSALSLLGLGQAPPEPSWGNMLDQSLTYMRTQWFVIIPPGLAIMSVVLASNALADALRDALSFRPIPPRSRRRRDLASSAPGAVGAPPDGLADLPSVPEFDDLPPGLVEAFGSMPTIEGTDHGDGSRDPAAPHVGLPMPALLSQQFETPPAVLPDPPSTAVLSVRGVRIDLATPMGVNVAVVEDIGFDVDAGEIVGLVGESGSGKSMTAHAVMGVLPPVATVASGTITIAGQDVAMLDDAARRRWRALHAGIVFQNPFDSLNPGRRVGSQLIEASRYHGSESKAALRGRAAELLHRVGIADPRAVMSLYPHQLSGGMAQRVMIAMALMTQPRLLIADEPTTALDVTVQRQVLDLFRELATEMGVGVLFITHDLGVVADVCDRVAVMYAGQIVETRDAHALFAAPGHPYTASLLDAVRQRVETDAPLKPIRGSVPALGMFPPGCRFAPRCDHAEPKCLVTPNPLVAEHDGSDHRVRCIRYAELAAPVGVRR